MGAGGGAVSVQWTQRPGLGGEGSGDGVVAAQWPECARAPEWGSSRSPRSVPFCRREKGIGPASSAVYAREHMGRSGVLWKPPASHGPRPDLSIWAVVPRDRLKLLESMLCLWLQVAGGQGPCSQVVEVLLCRRPLQMGHTAQLPWQLQPPWARGPCLCPASGPRPPSAELSGRAAPTACGPPCGPGSSQKLTHVSQNPRRPHSPGCSVSDGEKPWAWKPDKEARGWVPVERESGGKLRGQCWAQVGVGDRASWAKEAAGAKALRLGDFPGTPEQGSGLCLCSCPRHTAMTVCHVHSRPAFSLSGSGQEASCHQPVLL